MTSVLHRTGVTFGKVTGNPSQLITPANLQGRTQHFAVYADPALGADGKLDSQEVVAKCEADYAIVSGYFGGLSAGPFNVVLFSNPDGAFHATCAATDLFCDAATVPPNGDYSEFLNIAEFVEVFEAVQARGWDCGKCNGEGLSRVLAANAYPAELDGFATAATWLEGPRQNFVDKNFNGDTNPHANGCSVLFLNWLRFQLKFSWSQIVGAAAPTLGRSYTHLTGKKDGFKQFQTLVNAHFPKGKKSGLTTDNPFPL
jgi:hypothetical protein